MANRSIGLMLIGFGVLFLAAQAGLVRIGWDILWPLFVLIPGLMFELGYLMSSRKNGSAGLLVPGGILSVIGLLFFFEVATDWRFSEYTWPTYLLAVAFGLFQFYVTTSPKAKPLLIPIGILTAISLFAFAAMVTGKLLSIIFSGPVLGIVLVGIGIYLMTVNRRKN